jgi:hypothetical protein
VLCVVVSSRGACGNMLLELSDSWDLRSMLFQIGL